MGLRETSSEESITTSETIYIHSFLFDHILIIATPLLAFFMAFAASSLDEFFLYKVGRKTAYSSLVHNAFTNGHLLLVFFRSHLNPSVFNHHRKLFIWVPLLILLGLIFSDWFLVTAAVIAVFWDVYHSAMQTFGIGRIYDHLSGTLQKKTRMVDLNFNLLLYIGPILAGPLLVKHFAAFNHYRKVDSAMSWPEQLVSGVQLFSPSLAPHAWALIILATFYFLWSYHYDWKNGERVCWPKIALYLSTAFCNIYAWGFNPLGKAFFVVNFYHAVQYFALIWIYEKDHLLNRIGYKGVLPPKFTLFMGVVLLPLGLGFLSQGFFEGRWLFVLLTFCALLHFWMDGIIWKTPRGKTS